MTLPPISPAELLFGLVYAGLLLLLGIYLPVQIAAKVRRIRRSNRLITCRICGYRFIRRDSEATCSNCEARNR